MSSAMLLWVVPLVVALQGSRATFPPNSDSPPIPNQAVRSLDISGTKYYIQEETQPNPSAVKAETFFPPPPEIKVEEPRWYPENEPVDNSESTERFERYFESGNLAIGPVATPLPDDPYLPQQSLNSKVIPEVSQNAGPSDLWILTKGPNDQYVPERWVPMPHDRIVEVVNPNVSPKSPESVKSPFPPPPPGPITIKMSGPPPASGVPQQVWVRAPSPVVNQKVFSPPMVEEVPSIKQVADVPPSVFQQPQIVKGQPFVSPPQALVKSSFSVPPLPPPAVKSIDTFPTKQTVVNQPVGQVVDPVIDKGAPLQQVKHIWVPTSHQTGKFITVPVGSFVDSGKTIQSKGVPLDMQPPVSVSETWVLKYDGELPRFEQQSNVGPVLQKGRVVVDPNPPVQIVSPKNPLPQYIGKSIDNAPPQIDVWPTKPEIPAQTFVKSAKGTQFLPPQPVSPFPVKSDSVVVGKQGPIVIPPPQKSLSKSIQASIPVLQQPVFVKNGKPCPVPSPKIIPVPPKSIISPKSGPLPAYRTVSINRPPFARIVRVNRYPYGSYYALNPRVSPSIYPYPRTQGPLIQQARNGIVRLVSARQLGVPLSPKRITISNKLEPLPIPNGKYVAPNFQPQLLFPSVNRARYSYPWGNYIRPFPITGKNVFVLPSNRLVKTEPLKSSSSSSSESSSSESKSSERKKSKQKKKKPKKVSKKSSSESISSAESKEMEPLQEEPEEVVETAASVAEEAEAETETEASPEVSSESSESTETEEIKAEESQIKPQIAKKLDKDFLREKLQVSAKPFILPQERGSEGEAPDSRIVGTYSLYDHRDGTLKNYAYISDAGGYRSHAISIPNNMQYRNAIYKNQPNVPESSTLLSKTPEVITALPTDNLDPVPPQD